MREWLFVGGRRPGLAPPLPASLLFDAGSVLRWPHISPFGMAAVAQRVLDERAGNPFVLATGSARAEGALIATFAELDPARSHFVLRGTQQLGADDFMGTRYRLRFETEDELAEWLRDSGTGWVVVDDSAPSRALSHNVQLMRVLAAAPAEWQLVRNQPSADGEVRLYRHAVGAPSPEQARALLARTLPNQ